MIQIREIRTKVFQLIGSLVMIKNGSWVDCNSCEDDLMGTKLIKMGITLLPLRSNTFSQAEVRSMSIEDGVT